MNSSTWQADFAQSLSQGLSTTLADSFANKQHIHERFAIYQNNIVYSLTQALGELYPIIKQLVGDNFFTGTASAYLKKHPPTQAAMVYFGWDFPTFLSNFEHTQTMPYLSDMAQLELNRHRAYHAADAVAMTAKDFHSIASSVFEKAQCELHPSVQLLTSAYPIFSIWKLHQQQEKMQTMINLNEPQAVIVVRVSYELQLTLVDEGTCYFYQLLKDKHSIYSAASQVTERVECDIAAAIRLGIKQGYFSRLYL